MGAASYSLLSDDTALDVRDTWDDVLRRTQSSSKATAGVLREFRGELKDDDEGPIVWLTLALLQHKHGCLTKKVQSRALAIIKKGEGLDLWREAGPAELKRREGVYARVETVLKSKQPALNIPRPLPTPRPCPFKAGDILSVPISHSRVGYVKVLMVDQDFAWLGLLSFDGPPGSLPDAWCSIPLRWFTHRHPPGDEPGMVRGDRCISVMSWWARQVPRKQMQTVANCPITKAEERCIDQAWGMGQWVAVRVRVQESLQGDIPDFTMERPSMRRMRLEPGSGPTDR